MRCGKRKSDPFRTEYLRYPEAGAARLPAFFFLGVESVAKWTKVIGLSSRFLRLSWGWRNAIAGTSLGND